MPWPLITAARLAAWGLLGLGLAGCSDPATPSAEDLSSRDSAPTALPATGELDTRCTDPAHDTGAGGDDDLAGVAMVADADQLVAAFSFVAAVPTRGELLLTVEVHSADGTQARQLGVQLRDGRPQGAFVMSSPTSEPLRLENSVHVTQNEVHAAFPASALQALGSHWTWFGMSGDRTAVADFCPGSAGTSIDTVRPVTVD